MTVIVGVDGSDSSKAALRLAAQEARWRQASLVAVSAYELPLGPVGGFPGAAMQPRAKSRPPPRRNCAPRSTMNSVTKPGRPRCAPRPGWPDA